jgi:hypothetical protein
MRFSQGQYVELYSTIPAQDGGSIPSGTRGVVQAIDPDHPREAIYLVAFLANEKFDGQSAWLREVDLFPG